MKIGYKSVQEVMIYWVICFGINAEEIQERFYQSKRLVTKLAQIENRRFYSYLNASMVTASALACFSAVGSWGGRGDSNR